MGVGKSTIGRGLAQALDLHYCDTDLMFEEANGITVADYFDQEGGDKFRRAERDLLRSLVVLDQCVVSTGGGTPCFYDNMQFMRRIGTTVYLKAPLDHIIRRVSRKKWKRPLLKNLEGDELRAFISNLLNEREEYYAQADMIIEDNSAHVETRVGVLVEKFKNLNQ